MGPAQGTVPGCTEASVHLLVWSKQQSLGQGEGAGVRDSFNARCHRDITSL